MTLRTLRTISKGEGTLLSLLTLLTIHTLSTLSLPVHQGSVLSRVLIVRRVCNVRRAASDLESLQTAPRQPRRESRIR